MNDEENTEAGRRQSCLDRRLTLGTGWFIRQFILSLVPLFVLTGTYFPLDAATLPTGFTESQVGGLSSPTAMELAPDGRLFVCLQGGQLRVIKNGALLATPFLTLMPNSLGERGLLGVAFDPNFLSNNFVYVYYTATTPAIHNRVSRFTANGDVAVQGSETVILDLDNLSGATNHNGGAIHFGADSKLYVAVGENANGANSQTLNNRLGKMLRVNSDGSIPSDNPFFNTATGLNRAIWALGLRNPFTFAFQPGTGRMFINDVGQNTWEEINDGIAMSNYGWPDTEGATSDSRFRTPLFSYGHGSTSTTGCAIAGGAFYNPTTVQFPSSYVGQYFFADLCGGWIRLFDPANNTATGFATGINQPVDLKVGPDGSLYYLSIGAGAVFRVQFPTPILQTEENTDHLIAFDSVTMLADPFPLDTTFNFSTDHRTRIMFFALNANLLPGEISSAVTAQVEDPQARVFPVAADFVGPVIVPNLNGLSEIVITLPDGLAGNSGEMQVSIMLRGKTSNKVRFRMR